MRRAVHLLVLLLAGVFLWLLLGRWLPGGSERFYLVVPPVFLAYILLDPAGKGKGWRRQLLTASVFVGGLALFAGSYGWLLVKAFPGNTSAGLTSGFVLEVLAACMFFTTAALLLLVSRSLFRNLLYGLERWCFPAPASRGRAIRLGLCDALAVLLLLALSVPYLLGALYIHRFKVPNFASPQSFSNRAYEDVSFTTDDRLTLRGWFIPAARPTARTLIICHGLNANRSNFLYYLRVGDTLDANVLMFDFRGHGDSDGHTVSMGYHERLDVLAAVGYLRAERPRQAHEVMGLGISMGASALVQAAAEAEPPLDGVILDSGFASALDLTDHVLQIFPAGVRPLLTLPGVPLASLHAGCWLSEVRPVDQIGAVRAPVLIIHARGDRLIPADHATRLYEAAVMPKRLWIAPTEGHGSAIFQAEDDYLRIVREWAGYPSTAGLTGGR